jgi:ankyrin repeat protein
MNFTSFTPCILFLTLALNTLAMDDDLWPGRSPSPTPRLRQKTSPYNEASHKMFLKDLLKTLKDKKGTDVDKLLGTYLQTHQTLDCIFHTAVTKNQHNLVRYLVNNYSENIVVNIQDEKGRSALHKAARTGSPAIVDQILSLWPNVNSKTGAGNTPLHAAAKNGNTEVLKRLLQPHHAATLEARNLKQQTPLVVAVTHAQLDAYHFLIKRRANINVISKEGTTLLHSAVHSGYLPTVLNLIETHKLDTCAHDGHNRTPYDIAHKNEDANMLANLKDYPH